MRTIRDATGVGTHIAPLYTGREHGIVIHTDAPACLSINQAYEAIAALMAAIAVAEEYEAEERAACWHTFLPKRGPYEPVAPPCMTVTEAASAATEALERIVAGFGR